MTNNIKVRTMVQIERGDTLVTSNRYSNFTASPEAETIEESIQCIVRMKAGKQPLAFNVPVYGRTEFGIAEIASVRDLARTIAENADQVYGAVWTGTGLALIAELNDEGEFELL